MAEPLKNVYNLEFIKPFASVCKIHIPNFDTELFEKHVFDKNWKNLELKARMRHIANCLHKQLTNDTVTNLECITQISEHIRINENKEDTFEYLILPDYVEVYGLENLEASLNAIEKITILASCEFAIRPYILKYPEKTLGKLLKWSKHKHASVRRLASEGSRPRLPWGMGLAPYKKDPSPIFPILDILKDDPSLYVRRSVANNINDISKDHPKQVLSLLKRWNGTSEERNWMVKHAARTLLKQGNPDALALFGYADIKTLETKNFNVKSPTVQIGDYLLFDFSISNKSKTPQKVRLEYFVHFLLANGKQSKKIFKISERELAPNETLNYEKRHSFKIISTRKYYTGRHQVSLVINGIEMESLSFELAISN